MNQRGPAGPLLALTAAIAAVLLWPRNASAATFETSDAPVGPPAPDDASQGGFWPLPVPGESIPELDPVPIPSVDVAPHPVDPLPGFLYMIRHTENTRADADSGLAYQTFYGGSKFYNLADHPAITGEKAGVPLSDAMCRAAGFSPGCVSTAAGAYQIIKPTWQRVRKAGVWGPYLGDFTPASQDEAARRLLIERKALNALNDGNLPLAVQLASKEWASLPGSTAGQRQYSYDQAIALFNEGSSYG